MGNLRVYCLKTLNKLSIYPLDNTPSAPSVRGCKLSREGKREQGRKPLHTEWTQCAMRAQRDGCIPSKLSMQPGGPSCHVIKVNNACQELLIRETGLDWRLKFDHGKCDQRF